MRPEILFPLFAATDTLKGVGVRVAPALARVAGPLVRDVLFLPPSGFVRRPLVTVDQVREGEAQTLIVEVEAHEQPRRADLPWKIRCYDGTGFLTLVFFKRHGDYLLRKYPVGEKVAVSGKVERFGSEIQMAHPKYAEAAEKIDEIPKVETVYPASGDLTSARIRKFALEALERAPELPEWCDPAWLEREKLPTWRAALEALHNPDSEADVSPMAKPRRRLAYDELLAHQLALAQRKAARRSEPAPAIAAAPVSETLEKALPWTLTGAQIRALSEVRGDLASGERMSRLLQGDVGAGKTVVAMLAMADVAAAGLQSALMAPTEILARQHFETIAEPLAAQGIKAVLLTGRDKGKGRAEKVAAIADGSAAVAVGTHALFQDDVAFKGLALAVIDEQHRFGVSQRKRMQDKSVGAHLLAMSATPIPRTLELTVFGDLDISRIDEKPPGRTPVATRAVPAPRMGEIVERLRGAIASGAQAFWICPAVAESEVIDLAAAENRAKALKKALGPSVGLVHGQLPAADKDAVMADFADGKVSVLVATTVVEVGVDVPNATIMVIEQAERFGLAQLHQLRGRVGRGKQESACVLLYDPPLSQIASKRLDLLRRTDDGFAIAELDLELRGGGDPLGLRQSGFPAYKLADPAAHRDLIAVAADDARLILSRDAALTSERGKAVRLLQELFDWKPEGLTDAG